MPEETLISVGPAFSEIILKFIELLRLVNTLNTIKSI